jgi:SF-assemblin/beta giardin
MSANASVASVGDAGAIAPQGSAASLAPSSASSILGTSASTTGAASKQFDPVATKQKLKSLTEGLDEFASLLQAGSRQRKEVDEQRIAELKLQVHELEREISVETERRGETSRALQAWGETQVATIKTKLEALLASNKAEIAVKFDALHRRIDEVEVKFESDRERVMADVKKRNDELLENLRAFAAVFEAERKSRMEREQRILDRLAKQEHESIKRFDDERHIREQVYMATKKSLEEAVTTRSKLSEKFEEATLSELAALRNAIIAEERARAKEDEEIASVLHAYVQKLQASMAVALSTDEAY